MKCRHFFSFALVAFLSFFFGSFITTHNSFALEDRIVVLSPDTSYVSGTPIFSDCDSSCFSQYNYLIVKRNSYDRYNGRRLPLNLTFQNNDSYSLALPGDPNGIIFQNVYNVRIDGNFTTPNSYYVYTLILTDSLSSCSPAPSGDISITSNGTYDVTNYASASVNVPAEVIQGDYHNDLVNINQSIIVCGAILLVLYFFYCIYRLIIKNSGVH